MRPFLIAAGLLLTLACDPTTPGGGSTTPEPEPDPTTCDEASDAVAAELFDIRACTTDDECGQELTGTSCGCTRNLVARNDADDTRFRELMEIQQDLECDGFFSTCDCPPAIGFACIENACTWNYL